MLVTMRIVMPVPIALLAGCLWMCCAAPSLRAQASATQIWLARTGDDAGPGSRNAPCKTLAAALAKVAPGGEIHAVGDGDFGPANITKMNAETGRNRNK